MGEESKLTEEDKMDIANKLAAKMKQIDGDKLAAKMKQIEEENLIKKAKLINETRRDKARRYVLGPFQFLAFSLITSESMLAYWMFKLFDSIDTLDHTGILDPAYYYERIVVGSLSIAVLIAVLAVFSVVYKIKKNHGDCEH